MKSSVFVFDPTVSDKQSKIRGVGRYLQILKDSFPRWHFSNNLTIKQFDNDSVFINPFFNLLQPPLLMRRVAKKQTAVIHDLIPLKYPAHFPIGIKGKINVFLNKLALKNYDAIVTDSQASKKDIVQMLGVSEDRVTVVYPCLPKIFTEKNQKSKIKNQNYNSKLKNNSKTFNFSLLTSNFCLYVGDATWNKNLVNLARAIKIINVTCVFVGKVFEKAVGVANEVISPRSGLRFYSRASQERRDHERQNLPRATHPWQQELKQFLEEIKDDKRFIFAGFVDDYRLLKLYQQARVNVLISRDEGFGLSYLEAASQRCPSVLSDISVFREIAKDNAWFANPNDPNDIANKIGEIYFNNDLRNKLGLKAEERSQFFSQKKFKKEFLKVMNYPAAELRGIR